MKKVTIDMVSDVVCPWCIIGYERLQKAIAQLDDIEVTIQFHPFELNPNMPQEGQDVREHIMEKYGLTPAQSDQNRKQLIDAGASVGFKFDYFDGMRMANTFNAHQVLHYAGENGKQEALKLRLFAAYFSERRNVNDIDVLVNEAVSVGLNEQEVSELLANQTYADVVREHENLWLQRGIQSVPTFVIGNSGVAGAQDPDTLAQFIVQASTEQ
ncbi:disulfide bond formation protein DsbA [Alteromonas sp. KS69]|uniref:DsbA family oxidoreductase n=1 Tax=unclassified Alteromonas TaxID=2614992 RepID=UPI000C484A89|nr:MULTISPECIES: DsbA family oxidoreductase [unclassified Alteromonas]MBB68134.1 disulfide bond formation protein DsbA [Rickettsiales bacterium]MBO7921607.1 DsbA family oxidoreductase [Alteromonas sp. K632G]RUP80675.1 disulfide bond formation protein DsbA [Alteromonas sp. KS69]